MNTELRVEENVRFRAISNLFIFLLYILAFFVCLFCVSSTTDVLHFPPIYPSTLS